MKYLEAYAIANGFVLNKDSIPFNRILYNREKWGANLCPCQHITEENLASIEVCPCESLHDAIEISGKCYCGVFVRKE